MYRPILASLAAAGMIFGGVVGVAEANATPSPHPAAAPPPTDVRAEPAATPGPNPFAPPAGGPQNALSDRQRPWCRGRRHARASTGARTSNACDSHRGGRLPAANPDRGQAFAAAEGITPKTSGAISAGLTPVTLRADTAVTNNGFTNGVATPVPGRPAGRHRGHGRQVRCPQVRCACGNPLHAPSAERDRPASPATRGRVSRRTTSTVITPSATGDNEFDAVTPTNETIGRPTHGGTHGGSDDPVAVR